MRWFYAVLALLLLNPSLVVGLDTSEPYIEAFLTSLPHRIVYWTRSEVSYGPYDPPYRSFTTARIVHEDGTTRYFLQESGLVVVEPHPTSKGRKIFTHHFYFIPTAEESLALYDPRGQEIAFVVTDKPVVRSRAESQQMQNSASTFAALTLRYSRLQDEDSDFGEQFWGPLGFSLLLSGMTALSVVGAANAQDELEVLTGVGGVVLFGLVAVFCAVLAIDNLKWHRRNTKEIMEITAQLEDIIAEAD